MSRRWAAWALALAAVGCTTDRTAEVVCDRLCACASTLPSLAAFCVDQCVDNVGGRELPGACLPCVEAETCDALNGGACRDVCDPPPPAASSSREEMP